MIYHLLPEAEPFSEYHGGALSRWAANVLRGDENCTIVCPWADATWGFPPQRVWSLSGFKNHVWWSKIVRSGMAIALRLTLLRRLFRPLFNKLQMGDTVYIHNRPEFALALGSMCRRKGAHIVLHMQNSHLRGVPARYQSLLDVDAVVFCSSFLKKETFQFVPRVNIGVVIPNGADDSMFYPERISRRSGDHVPVILFASRLVQDKGPHIFLEAMRLLRERRVQAKGIIVGSSNFGAKKSTKFVKELHRMAPQNAEFRDYCSGKALAEIFRKADIFCLPSVWNDPFPLVVLEAMASRLPIVATSSGGIPEAFTEGGGVLVQRGSASELAAALERLVAEPSLRDKMAEDGYTSFQKNFTWAIVRAQYHRVLDSLPA